MTGVDLGFGQVLPGVKPIIADHPFGRSIPARRWTR